MAHHSGTMNFVIQDTNGNPQLIKVQKAPQKGVKHETVKLIAQKPATVTQVISTSGGTIIPQGAQVLRAVTIQGKQRQFVTIPVSTSFQNVVRQESQQTVTQTTKAVQLSPQPQVVVHNNAKAYVSPVIETTNKKRKEAENEFMPELYNSCSSKRRKSDKCGKGLRHFSMKVCEKVRKKGTTSYNEVADELVSEFTNPNLVPNSVDQQYDQKNIRRRVYDALNVLMAMNIIAKEKKEIRWLGLPTTSAQECGSLINEKKQLAERIQMKTQQLNDLILQQISFKNLIQRNYENQKIRGPPAPNSAIHMPFIVVNSDRKTIIDCSITNDKKEYLFHFNDKFQIHDDFEILKQIGLTYGLETGNISEANLAKIKAMLPKSMEKYINKISREPPAVVNGFIKEEEDQSQLDYLECASTSRDSFLPEEVESPLEEEDSDQESNVSTDVDIN